MKFQKFCPIYLFFFISLFALMSKAQSMEDYRLIVKLNKAPFDSLYLHDYTNGVNILIPGKKIKDFTWEIIVPNDLSNDENMELLASPYQEKSNSKQRVRFITGKDGSNITVANIGVEDKINYIYGDYKDTAVFENESVLTKIDNKDSLIVGKLVCSDFKLIIKDANSDIAVRSQDPLFSWFIDLNSKAISYDNQLESYIKLAKKYPDSRFLLSNLAGNLTKYKTVNDLRKVYINFSNKHKNTIWAKHIEQFLDERKFLDTFLPTVNKNSFEKIIQDTSKYNLVVFTASWCMPCIEEIPILKEIYKDLGRDLIITYVSIDDEKGVVSFKKLINEKNILWRSLFAYRDINKIKQKYFIEGIPKSILVYPSQDMDVLDVRKDEDRIKLYNLIKEKRIN